MEDGSGPFEHAVVVTVMAAIALLIITIFFPRTTLWGTPERPRQCEALEVEARNRLHRSMQLYGSQVHGSTLREPQNTWSNLTFLFFGSYLLYLPSGRKIDRWMGVVLVYQFFASGLYHASLMPAFRDFDMIGVFALAGLFCLMAVHRCLPQRGLIDSTRMIAGTVLMFSLLAFLRARVRVGELAPLDTMVVLPIIGMALVFAVFYLKFHRRERSSAGIAALAVFGVGLTLGGLDRVGHCLCDPRLWIQGHAVWHVSAAVAAYLFCQWSAAAPSLLANSPPDVSVS